MLSYYEVAQIVSDFWWWPKINDLLYVGLCAKEVGRTTGMLAVFMFLALSILRQDSYLQVQFIKKKTPLRYTYSVTQQSR